MKYFGIYANSGAVQTAIETSALTKPYVAIVSGVVDYNSVGNATARTGVWIEDSLGNEYSGTLQSNMYQFNFQKRADATFTLYEDEQVVTASSYGYWLHADCEEDYAEIYSGEDQDYPVEDIDYFTGDYDSSTTVSVDLVYDLGNGSVSITMDVEDCDICWEAKSIECEEGGMCWDGENHECNACPSCEDLGECGEYPDCHACSCEDEGLCEDAETGECVPCGDDCDGDPECECLNQGGSWNGEECEWPEDPCQEDPCSCDPNPDECRCTEQGGTWDPEANDGAGDCIFE